ncbi:hypothetical protein I8752_22825 [Nostocaceae cyanobacterium CENA369]|uniref:Uncharacterized protein n=1 Tax=Dendronalium phyllosphericum CENA369 TaxID=1725256 RepID=A0A8J7LJQ3_9NOST|nr:hypothetical protein [Dendronalium phyllosphericum]MBH8575784.1 hypothetical protein [Dendronalium phyllosphericum CENA369]
MTTKCWRFSGKGFDNNSYEFFACGEVAEFRSAGNGGVWLFVDGSNVGGNGYYYQPSTATVNAVADETPTSGYTSSGSCATCRADKYDCLNGQCIPKTTYNTPGLYNSLEDCQAVCANGGACAEGKKCVDPTTFCPDGHVCIEQGEYNSIQGLVDKIKSEVC